MTNAQKDGHSEKTPRETELLLLAVDDMRKEASTRLGRISHQVFTGTGGTSGHDCCISLPVRTALQNRPRAGLETRPHMPRALYPRLSAPPRDKIL